MPHFKSIDGCWHLTAETPVEIYEGAVDMSFRFKNNNDDRKRTVPCSMGAYEFDKK